MNFKKLILTATASMLFSGAVHANIDGIADPVAKGLAIATEAQKRDEGWSDSATEMTMILRTKQGKESKRKMKSQGLEKLEDGDKSIIIFNHPKDVKGIALLTHSHKVDNDDQWIYFPARKRVRRIASDNKSGPFMGSEFAYEDLSSQEVEKYTYKFIKDDEYNGMPVYISERYPVDENSGYTRQIVTMDKEHFRVQKLEFYDRKESLLKTLEFSDYKQYLDKYWRPAKMHMVNHQTGKETVLTFEPYEFGKGLQDRDFDQSRLKLAR